jgi:hypothetical protein
VWWDRSEIAEIYLSPSCVGVASAASPVPRWIEAGDGVDALQAFERLLAEPPASACARVRVWLGSTWTRPLLVPADAGARDAREATALAAMLAADAVSFDGPVLTWSAPWRRGRDTLAVVLPLDLWNDLRRVVGIVDAARRELDKRGDPTAARSLRLASVRPWWNQALDGVLADSGRATGRFGWSLVEPDGIVHGLVEDGALRQVGFDLPGAHDRGGALLRRRLEATWSAEGDPRHLDFSRAASSGAVVGIGSHEPWHATAP